MSCILGLIVSENKYIDDYILIVEKIRFKVAPDTKKTMLDF
jgi:hypothetical protein